MSPDKQFKMYSLEGPELHGTPYSQVSEPAEEHFQSQLSEVLIHLRLLEFICETARQWQKQFNNLEVCCQVGLVRDAGTTEDGCLVNCARGEMAFHKLGITGNI